MMAMPLGPLLPVFFSVLLMGSIIALSIPLAVFLILAALLVALTIYAYRGRYFPRFIMDVLDRLTDRSKLEQTYQVRARRLTTIDAEQLADLVKTKVVGQNKVVDAIALQLRRRLAARRPDKPVAVFCLAGPPGVGKTLLAKVLAEELYGGRDHLHFFDMSQFGQPHAAASLFGQARGYVGSTSYGTLTAALRDRPDAVVLLDEFEKADPEVHKRFLTAWNDGFVTEVSDGARISTAEAIFVLTTNAASRRIGEIIRDHADNTDETNRLIKSALLDAQFAPEVLSRIDNVFALSPLQGLDIARVVALQMEDIAGQFDLEIAGGGIDPDILMRSIESMQRLGDNSVRDISRSIEHQITDCLLQAREEDAREVRLVSAGDRVDVVVSKHRTADQADMQR